MPYKIPEHDVVAIVDAPPTPVALLAPGGRHVALVHYESHPPVALLARRYLPLAGIRIDPALACRQRVRRLTGLSVLRLADGAEQAVPLPAGAQVSVPTWAPDGRSFVFTVDEPDGLGVWVGDAESVTARQVPGLRVRDVIGGDPLTLGAAVRWSRDGGSLLALGAPGEPPALPEPPIEPRVEETEGKRSQMATYQDLLLTAADEDAFEALATTVPLRVEPRTGSGQGTRAARALPAGLGVPGRRAPARAPAAAAVLVPGALPLLRPHRRGVVGRGRHRARARRTGRQRRGAPPGRADRPAAGVVGGRGAGAAWLWTEALDGGDPVAPAEHRDRVMRLAAPFTDDPRPAFEVEHRCLGWLDLDEPDRVLLTEHDRDRRWLTTWVCDLADAEPRRKLFDHSMDDAYADPGSPLMTTHPDGRRTALQDGSAIYLRGDGSTPEGDRPFLDRLDLATLASERLYQSPPDALRSRGRIRRRRRAGPRRGRAVAREPRRAAEPVPGRPGRLALAGPDRLAGPASATDRHGKAADRG